MSGASSAVASTTPGPGGQAAAQPTGLETSTEPNLRGVARIPVLRPLRILPGLRPLVAAGLLLVLIGIQSPRSLWLTEALSVRAARVTQPGFTKELRADDLGTAVSLVLTRLVALHTTYPEVVRVPGYVLAVLTVLLLASAGRRLVRLVGTQWRPPAVAKPASVGVAAALVAACHGELGTAAATVGPGALTVFVVALAVDLLLRAVDRGHWVTTVAAGVVGGAAVATHLSAAAAVLGALIAAGTLPRDRLPVSRFVVVTVLTVGVGAALAALTLGQANARSQWAGTPGQTGSLGASMTLLGGGAGPGEVSSQPGKALARLATLALVLLIGLALLHLARMLRVAGRSAGTFVLALPLALLLLPLLAAALAGAAGVEGAAGRSLVAAVPGVVLLAAVELYRSGGPTSAWLGVAEWRNGYSAAAIAATGALLGSLLVGVGGVSVLPCVGGHCAVEQWSLAVSKIETLREPRDVAVIYAPETVLPYDLAATRVAARLKLAGEPPMPHVSFPSSVDVGLAESAEPDTAERLAEVGAAYGSTRTAPRAWLVLSHVGTVVAVRNPTNGQLADLRSSGAWAPAVRDLYLALTKKYGNAFFWTFRGVTVILFSHSALKPVPAED